jgi:hypothetical protein
MMALARKSPSATADAIGRDPRGGRRPSRSRTSAELKIVAISMDG